MPGVENAREHTYKRAQKQPPHGRKRREAIHVKKKTTIRQRGGGGGGGEGKEGEGGGYLTLNAEKRRLIGI